MKLERKEYVQKGKRYNQALKNVFNKIKLITTHLKLQTHRILSLSHSSSSLLHPSHSNSSLNSPFFYFSNLSFHPPPTHPNYSPFLPPHRPSPFPTAITQPYQSHSHLAPSSKRLQTPHYHVSSLLQQPPSSIPYYPPFLSPYLVPHCPLFKPSPFPCHTVQSSIPHVTI